MVKTKNYEQEILPFAVEGKRKALTVNGEVEPVRFVFHKDGTISVRVAGHWHHNQQLTPSLYLSAPGSIRERIIRAEYQDGQPRVSGSSVLVTRVNNKISAETGRSF